MIRPMRRAFEWLEKPFDAGEIGNFQLKIDPLYDGLRDDPRYARPLARIGLTPWPVFAYPIRKVSGILAAVFVFVHLYDKSIREPRAFRKVYSDGIPERRR
jgi:hypothetical protein